MARTWSWGAGAPVVVGLAVAMVTAIAVVPGAAGAGAGAGGAMLAAAAAAANQAAGEPTAAELPDDPALVARLAARRAELDGVAGADSGADAEEGDGDATPSTPPTLTASFVQSKTSRLLRRPIESRGVVRMRGTTSLWETQSPRPFTMRIGDDEVRFHYPEDAILEVYDLRAYRGLLAVEPRVDPKRLHETFGIAEARAFLGDLDPERYIGLTLVPRDPALRDAAGTIGLVVDLETLLVRESIVRESEGSETRTRFTDVRTGVALTAADVALEVPDDTEVQRIRVRGQQGGHGG